MRAAPLDFENESYVRIYTRDHALWLAMGFSGQTVWLHTQRKLDRAGVLMLSGMDPAAVISLVTGAPIDLAREGLTRLVSLGVLLVSDTAIVDPWFLPAQEARKNDAQRQREVRERRRAQHVDKPVDNSKTVTICDSDSQDGPQESRDERSVTKVTLCFADPVPCSALPSVALPDVAAEAHRRTFAQVGAERLNSVDRRLRIRVGRGQDSELEEIGSAPAEDWETVARVLASEIAKGNARYITPRAVAKHWVVYATGTVPGQQRPPAGVLPGANYKPASAPDPNYKRQEDHPTLARLLSAAGAASKAVAT